MKRGTPDHWKMRELARLLNLPARFGIATANGIMERLWHYTAKFHPRGDIGASPDWAIADACGWSCGTRTDRLGQDSDKLAAFIDALVVARWLDRDKVCRLLVHDWADHADSSVKKWLKDRDLSFASLTLDEGSDDPAFPFLSFPEPSLPSGAIPIRQPDEIRKQKVAGLLAEKLAEQQAESELAAKLTIEELERAFDRHKKQKGFPHPKRADVFRQVIAMLPDFDVSKFRANHPRYCEYWDAHGWGFSNLTFLEWIENGMLDPPPESAGVKTGRMAEGDRQLEEWANA